jgi:hypothetical protein
VRANGGSRATENVLSPAQEGRWSARRFTKVPTRDTDQSSGAPVPFRDITFASSAVTHPVGRPQPAIDSASPFAGHAYSSARGRPRVEPPMQDQFTLVQFEGCGKVQERTGARLIAA